MNIKSLLDCEFIQGDRKVSVHLLITIQKSGAQSLFDHPIYILLIIEHSGTSHMKINCQ